MNKLLPIDNITFWIFIGFWPLWLVWELAMLYLRGKDPNVDVISMTARALKGKSLLASRDPSLGESLAFQNM
jgi:hypothetical protein